MVVNVALEWLEISQLRQIIEEAAAALRRVDNAPENSYWRLIGLVIICTASLVLLLTSPVDDSFWWQDAPRHALNGAFVLDFFSALPLNDPLGWASEYYIRYPALTFGFYPPLFYFWEGLFFAAFGVSQFVAQLAVTPFLVMLGFGGYKLARLLLPRSAALGTALLLLGTPGVSLWGRQVMLDIPAYAALLWTVVSFASFIRTGRSRSLSYGCVFLVAAVYLKLNSAFIVLPIAISLIVARGWRHLLERRMLMAVATGLVALIPLILLTIRFGAVNITNIAGVEGAAPMLSVAAWTFYLNTLPEQIGWMPVFFGSVGLIIATFRSFPLAPPLKWLFSAWLVVGYIVFSLISVREARHDLMVLFPLLLCSTYAVSKLSPKWLAGHGALAFGLLTFAVNVLGTSPPSVRGYRQVADGVVASAGPGAVVLFSGYRDGNFVFTMRTHPERADLRILRSDKLFLRMAVSRSWGVGEVGLNETELLNTLKYYGVSLVVAQRDFWNDIPQLHRLNTLLAGASFRRLASYEITGDLSTNDGRGTPGGGVVDLFMPTYDVPTPPSSIDMEIPFGGLKVHGKLSQTGTD